MDEPKYISTCCIADVGATHPSAYAADDGAAPTATRNAVALPRAIDRNR
jgi:hypothetical protein